MRLITVVSEIPTGRPLYIYGTGRGGQIMLNAVMSRRGACFRGFIDTFKGGTLNGAPVQSIDDYARHHESDAVVVIASQYIDDITATLRRHGIVDFHNGLPLVFRKLEKDGENWQRLRRWWLSVRTLIDETLILAGAVVLAVVARNRSKPIDVGLGPEPLINNIYHKQALETFGYRAETFVINTWFTTNRFDHIVTKVPRGPLPGVRIRLRLFWLVVSRYRVLYLYFRGGPLFIGLTPSFYAWRFEPALLSLGGVRTVVMPYGGDVQDMTRSRNLLFKHCMAHDYPSHAARRREIVDRIDLWTAGADHVISGCEWVDYMPSWHTLMLAHFSMDVEALAAKARMTGAMACRDGPLRLLHAPNHRWIKGTDYLLRAVDELRAEGVELELRIVENMSNDQVLAAMTEVDVVVDQLIVGWYALFAIEAMSMGKPVLCHLRPDLLSFYTAAGLLEKDEIPILPATWDTVKESLRWCALNRDALPDIGRRSQDFVRRHHSLTAIGAVFDEVNRDLGVSPFNDPGEKDSRSSQNEAGNADDSKRDKVNVA